MPAAMVACDFGLLSNFSSRRFERYPNSNEISYITPSIDYISESGYKSGNFSKIEEGWLPICIDESDLYLVENKLANICGIDKFYVWMVMQIFHYQFDLYLP